MSTESQTLQAIRYSREGGLQLLDQKLLPFEFKFVDINNVDDGWHAIRDMKVRGAPAIAIAAVLALAVECTGKSKTAEFQSAQAACDWACERLAYLKTSRPTAVNLFTECDKVAQAAKNSVGKSWQEVLQACVDKAEEILSKDVSDNLAIAKFGAEAILRASNDKAAVRVMTHCNAGALATAKHGTALGIVRDLHSMGRIDTAICTETRPYNQGARLTAFEFVFESIPAVLICDSMVAAFMSVKGVDAVVVGADRVVANGDTANKIGTLALAIAAKYHGVPFYVATPTSTVDLTLASGSQIVIEERAPEELTHINNTRIAAPGINVWNPQFDVTPAALITAHITEFGAVEKGPSGTFDMAAFLRAHSL